MAFPSHIAFPVAPLQPRKVPLAIFYCLLMALCLLALQPAMAADEADGWSLVSDRNDIKVYMKDSNNASRLKTFRGEMIIKVEDQYALAAILNDYDNLPKWLHLVDAATELSQPSPLLRYVRFATQLPWPLSNRDAVLQARVMQERKPPMPAVTIYLDGRPDLIPEQKGYVRFPEMNGIFAIEVLDMEKSTKITYQLTLDPGGYIPIWISNILLRDAPYFTLLRLRQRLKEPQYQNMYYDYLDLMGPGRPLDTLPKAP